jgi:hypothetical protein
VPPVSKHKAVSRGDGALARLESSRWFTPVAFLVILLSLVILFGDFVFSDKMLHGSDTLSAGYFFRILLVDGIKSTGSVPQWNPYIFGGMPYIEAFHGDIFYPLSYPFKRFMPLDRGLGWSLFWHIYLAGIFMYFAARQFKLGKTASLVSGVAYMFAPYLVSLVAPGHDGKIFVTTLFPLVILFIERAFESRPLLNFSLLGLVLGLIILSPHPQMSYFTLWGAGLYTLYKMIMAYIDTKAPLKFVWPGSLAAYAVVIGLLLSAIQFYPGYYYTTHFSPRADAKKGWDWATSWSMHAEEGMNLLIPEFSGASTEKPGTYYWGKNAFKDNSEAVGAVTFFLGILGLIISRRRERWFFGGLALFAFTYGLGSSTPLFHLYFLIPKVDSLRAPSMVMFLFSFSFALLAGFGVHHLLTAKEDTPKLTQKFRIILWGIPALMFVLALAFSAAGRGMISAWCSMFYGDAGRTMVQMNVSKFDVAIANLPAIQSGAWFAFLLTLLAALVIWLVRERKMAAGIMLALVALPVVDGMRFNSRFIGTVDRDAYFADNPMTQYLQKNAQDWRVLNLTQPKDDQLPYRGIDVPVGYHGNQLRWYDDLIGSLEIKNIYNPRVINLLGTKYLVNETGREIPADFLGPIPVRVASQYGQIQLVQNDNAFPRVYLANQYKVIPDRQQIYPAVLSGADDLRQTVYLEEEPGMPFGGASPGDTAFVSSRVGDNVTVNCRTAAAQLLVMTETWFDAWQVTIDNQPAKLLRAYGALRAIAVPAGNHEIKFEFHSPRYTTGKLLTMITALYLALVIGLSLFLMFRGKKPTGVAAEA